MMISFVCNGVAVTCEVAPHKRLVDVLRENFGLTGTKEACGRGECGSCTVLLDGARVNSCLIPAFQTEGRSVVTIEGVRDWPIFERIERAYIERGAVQCGLCIPGFVMSTVAVLAELEQKAHTETLTFAMAGNLCRCTGYEKIMDAVKDLAEDSRVRRQIAELVSGKHV
jgi:carbon-monoxide dehydrogenase small subunit